MELADGVWLYRAPDDNPRLSNSLVVERSDGLLVVDSQPTPVSAGLFRKQLATQLDAPIRYLVLSHPHAEAAGGASGFDDTGALLIGSSAFNRTMKDPESDFGAECRDKIGDGWVDPPRRSATLEILSSTRLDDERNTVDLLPLKRGHSRGDMTVSLPDLRLLYIGGVIYPDRNPYMRDGSAEGSLRFFNSLIRDKYATIVGIHGDPIAELELKRLRDGLAWLRGRITYHFVQKVAEAEIADKVLNDEGIEEQFNMDARPNFVRSVVESAITEMISDRKSRGYNSP